MAFFVTSGFSQERMKVEILNADEGKLDPSISNAQRFLGNVKLKYNETIMTCDSAYRYPNGDFDAFSRVRINQGDTLQLYGDLLSINTQTRIAQLRDNIRMKDGQMTLTTDVLDYDFTTEIASYFNGGKIISSANQNVLTSEMGFYDSRSEFFQFRDDVELKNPEYTVLSDTLKYSNKGEVAFFHGPTTIRSDQNTIYCENGWYNTQTDICQFNENAWIQSKNTYMEGDSIYYNGNVGYGEVFENVMVQDTTTNYMIKGNYAKHDEVADVSLVTDRAEMIQFFDTDSLFMHADTLLAVPDSMNNKLIKAYAHVKFYKSDLQGKCDSLTFSETDSLLKMLGAPIIWSKQNQISGERIDMFLFEGKIDRMYINKSALIVSEAVPSKYNQIKGRELTGYFRDNELHKIIIEGNGQLVYFPTEEMEDGTQRVQGVNRADCSDISIIVENSEIIQVSLLDKPSGALHPMSKAGPKDLVLEGFFWESAQRPLKREDIFNWIGLPEKTDQAETN